MPAFGTPDLGPVFTDQARIEVEAGFALIAGDDHG
jgi:hypothetical protein